MDLDLLLGFSAVAVARSEANWASVRAGTPVAPLTKYPAALSEALGVPVIPTVAVRRKGLDELRAALASLDGAPAREPRPSIGLTERRVSAEAIADGRREDGSQG